MKVLDISVPIHTGMVVYEGDPPVRLHRVASMSEGAMCNLSRLEMGVHGGTHIDAPLHFLDGGAGVEATPLEALVGPATVVDATGLQGDIDQAALAALDLPRDPQRLLFKTRNSDLWRHAQFSPSFIGILPEAARELVRRGVRLVGADYLSVAPPGDPGPTHRVLLKASVVILEGIDLSGVAAGQYTLICLPLLIPGAEAAPARALLVSQ